MRVLGIDCGTEYTGYGVVDLLPDGGLHCLACGAIQLSIREPLPARLSRIYEQLSQLILAHQPDQVAIEEVLLRSQCEIGAQTWTSARRCHAGSCDGPP